MKFLFGGRIGRLAYFGYSLLGGIFIGLAIGAAIRGLGFSLWTPSNLPPGAIALFILGFVLNGFIAFVLTIKRLHDLDLSGWWSPGYMVFHTLLTGASFLYPSEDLRAFALGTTLVVWFVLCFWPGSDGANRYGER